MRSRDSGENLTDSRLILAKITVNSDTGAEEVIEFLEFIEVMEFTGVTEVT